MDTNQDVNHAWTYHNATKHSEWSVRSSPHYLDWANQPLPLKIYSTLDPISLPREAVQSGISALSAVSHVDTAIDGDRIPKLTDLARILYFSAGITKKRTYPGGELYFRAASCTGALYEFELYLVCRLLLEKKNNVTGRQRPVHRRRKEARGVPSEVGRGGNHAQCRSDQLEQDRERHRRLGMTARS